MPSSILTLMMLAVEVSCSQLFLLTLTLTLTYTYTYTYTRATRSALVAFPAEVTRSQNFNKETLSA